MTLVSDAARCAARVARLLANQSLHVPNTRLGSRVMLPDGRTYVVFRESTNDAADASSPVVLVVWFRLRMIPPGARRRRWLFERLCIFNTVLFAGFDGYLVKLWMVSPSTSDYAGLYSWESAAKAEQYGRYITALLRPLSRRDSVGYTILADTTLDAYLQRSRA